MAELAESSSSTLPRDDKPVIVRVKRKASQSLLEALWLEINERPLKRSLLDFEKLSISDSSRKATELKTKKVFVQHVETINSSEVTVDILQSFMEPNSSGPLRSTSEIRRRTFKTESKHSQLLLKSKEKQEILAANARFKQIWRSRKGKKEVHDETQDMCRLYDIERTDTEEKNKEKQEQDDDELEDRRLMSRYLPLLREFIPSAAEEIECDIQDYVSNRVPSDDYVYDFYAVNNDMGINAEDASHPFPLVKVDDEEDFYDGPDYSDYETDDSNDENNPLNDYPDEEMSEDEEVVSQTSDEELDNVENGSLCNESSESSDGSHHSYSGGANVLVHNEFCYSGGAGLLIENESYGEEDIYISGCNEYDGCDDYDDQDDYEEW